jgi:hypothetical protein
VVGNERHDFLKDVCPFIPYLPIKSPQIMLGMIENPFNLLVSLCANAFLLYLSVRFVAKISMVKWWHSLLIIVASCIASLISAFAFRDVIVFFGQFLEPAYRSKGGNFTSLAAGLATVYIFLNVFAVAFSCFFTILCGELFWECKKRQSAMAALLWASLWLVFCGLMVVADLYSWI